MSTTYSVDKVFDDLGQKYKVEDIIPRHVEYIFVLESPHVDELIHGAPVSGRSGLAMTKSLFGSHFGPTALGILSKENLSAVDGDQILDRIGIMNVCQIPMQSKAYNSNDFLGHRERQGLVSIIEQIRNGNREKRRVFEKLRDLIRCRFQDRLERLPKANLIFIPCGDFARGYMEEVWPIERKWRYVMGIPHPSRNLWSRSQYSKQIQSLRDMVVLGTV